MGRFGNSLARRLFQLGNEVLVIDDSEERVRAIADDVTYAVAGDARKLEVLRDLGIANYDAAVVAIGADLSASILVTMNLKELGVGYIVCKAADDRFQMALEKVGADRVIIPEKTIGLKLAETLSSGNVLDFISLSDDYSIAEKATPKSWIGKSIREIDVRARYGVALLAVRRGSEMIISPGGDFVFETDDVILALGDNDALDKIRLL